MNARQELTDRIVAATADLDRATAELTLFDALAENNVYEDMKTALAVIQNNLRVAASDDCEGSGNCGLDEYVQAFIVQGVRYMATLKVEYNRHDKQYYYVDGTEFSYCEEAA